MASAADNRFIHGFGARLIAFVLGFAILVTMWVKWGDEMQELGAFLTGDAARAPIINQAGKQRVTEQNAALTTCLNERIGHVDQMLKDGVISDTQHEQFAARASALCRSQNPGPS